MSNDPNTKKEINGSCRAIQVLFQKAQEICKSDQVVLSLPDRAFAKNNLLI